MSDIRPNPDELLDKIQREDAKAQRGHFKLFFGSSAGVGKTFAMLTAAKAQQLLGVDVVIGIVETHGRRDTIAMTEGLETLPPQKINYHDKLRDEFDLDGALKRRPTLILMDELAHSNIPGTRHQKRWQDVEELLAAGINVYSTVNVQHLESLNDIVGQITGVRVWETIPDRVFDMADEVTLVDLPPDELLRRLKDGKVYIPHQAERASKNFFRKGNLIALRELALRRTADQVDAQMRDYRADQSIHDVWQAKERLLVCIGPHDSSKKLVRSAARLAASLRADLIAVYIETPKLQKLSDERREAIHKTLKLAQDLGAETTTLSGEKLAPILLSYAQSRNVTKLVIGKSTRPTWQRILQTSLADELASRTTDVDVYVVGHDFDIETGPTASGSNFDSASGVPDSNQVIGYLWAAVTCIAVTGITAGLVNIFDLANVIMVYLLAAVFVAIRFGRGPSIFASFLSVASFDFFFVPPKFSFSVSDTQYLFTFVIMLAVSLLISNLTANFRYQARIASYRERRANALNAMSKALSSALMVNQIIEISNEHLVGIFQAKIAILLPDSHDVIRQPVLETTSIPEHLDLGVAQWVYDNQQRAGLGTNTLPANSLLYVPLQAPMRTRGVLAIEPTNKRQIFQPEQQQLLNTFASQIALALERIHYVEVAQDALISIEAERLRNSLLSAISHDLRTPLTAIIGLSSTLEEQKTISEQTRNELIHGIHDEAQHMNSLIINLLDMAKLQSGKVVLNKQWQPIDEVIGSAVRLSNQLTRNIQLEIADKLPLISFDAVLIERVLINLIENAVKYGRAQITISAAIIHDDFTVSVSDNGPGLPPGLGEKIFDKFTRGEKESATHGVGLGLAICKAIIEAHQGKIWAENRPQQGAKISFTLPMGTPPEIESEQELTTE
ncbi:two-component system sensor histidine kinase KdpD [Oxalobacteraceae bacterium GrIS 2.11]